MNLFSAFQETQGCLHALQKYISKQKGWRVNALLKRLFLRGSLRVQCGVFQSSDYREFQRVGPATLKALSPEVVRGTKAGPLH